MDYVYTDKRYNDFYGVNMDGNINTKPKQNIGWYLDKFGKVISYILAIVVTIISI